MRVLLTGATGFLGMEVLARLLERGDVEIVALVRAPDAAGAAARLAQTLACLYERPEPAGERLIALAGDIRAAGLGLGSADRALVCESVDAVLHCAASVSFDLPAATAREVNVVGTAGVLELAARMRRLRRLVHVSTAYVAGIRGGVFHEHELDVGQRFRNSYERSKFEAELLLAERAGRLPLAIARPSIVVGDSRSGWTPAFNVIYWPLRAFARGLIRQAPVDPDGIVDAVGVDYVADALVHLLLDSGPGERMHLVAGGLAVTNTELIALACERFGRPPPDLGGAAAMPDQALPYLPYFDVATRFDDARAAGALRPAGIRPRPLGDCFGALMDYAERSRWGRRPVTRERALTQAAATGLGIVG